jgi:hypothetical protein
LLKEPILEKTTENEQIMDEEFAVGGEPPEINTHHSLNIVSNIKREYREIVI